jgi:hypothetical protein
LTVVGVLQALKGSPKTSSTSIPVLQKSYDTTFDFCMEQAVEDDEDNVQDRMIKTPLKETDLVRLLKEVVQVVATMPNFTLVMGEKPEKTVTYILDVLTYYGIRNSARNAVTTTVEISDMGRLISTSAGMQSAGSAPRFERRPDGQHLQQEFTKPGTVSAGCVELGLARSGV